MLDHSLNEEALSSTERCFKYVDNLAQVHHPDDFLGCYESIIKSWILAMHELKIPTASLAQKVIDLETSDNYGAFFDLQNRFVHDLGVAVTAALKHKLKK